MAVKIGFSLIFRFLSFSIYFFTLHLSDLRVITKRKVKIVYQKKLHLHLKLKLLFFQNQTFITTTTTCVDYKLITTLN